MSQKLCQCAMSKQNYYENFHWNDFISCLVWLQCRSFYRTWCFNLTDSFIRQYLHDWWVIDSSCSTTWMQRREFKEDRAAFEKNEKDRQRCMRWSQTCSYQFNSEEWSCTTAWHQIEQHAYVEIDMKMTEIFSSNEDEHWKRMI